MKVIYDIGVLGSSVFNQSSRTGIFRVVEEVAKKLSSDEEIELIFTAKKNLLIFTMKYLDSVDHFNSYKFDSSKALEKLVGITELIIDKKNKLNFSIGENDRNYILKIRRKAYTSLLKGMFYFLHDTIKEDLLSSDIFHSTYYNIQKNLNKYENLSVFQNIYDMIPIINSNMFKNKTNEIILKKTLNTIVNNKNGFIFTISESTKNDILNYDNKITPDRIFVTYLAASEKFKPCKSAARILQVKKKYGISLESKYILSVATLEPRKNLTTLIKSFRDILLFEKVSDLYLVLTGTIGWKNEQLFGEIHNSGEVSKKIILTGYVEDDDLAPLYSGAMAFVYPSIYEGFGLPPLESMQCGTPVITSNTSSLPEVVGDAGIMVDPYDINSISSSIFEIYNNDELRNKMSKKSIERASLFSWDKTSVQTIQAYKKSMIMK